MVWAISISLKALINFLLTSKVCPANLPVPSVACLIAVFKVLPAIFPSFFSFWRPIKGILYFSPSLTADFPASSNNNFAVSVSPFKAPNSIASTFKFLCSSFTESPIPSNPCIAPVENSEICGIIKLRNPFNKGAASIKEAKGFIARNPAKGAARKFIPFFIVLTRSSKDFPNWLNWLAWGSDIAKIFEYFSSVWVSTSLATAWERWKAFKSLTFVPIASA